MANDPAGLRINTHGAPMITPPASVDPKMLYIVSFQLKNEIITKMPVQLPARENIVLVMIKLLSYGVAAKALEADGQYIHKK